MTIDMTWEAREKIIRRDERAEGREEGRQEQLFQLVCLRLSLFLLF